MFRCSTFFLFFFFRNLQCSDLLCFVHCFLSFPLQITFIWRKKVFTSVSTAYIWHVTTKKFWTTLFLFGCLQRFFEAFFLLSFSPHTHTHPHPPPYFPSTANRLLIVCSCFKIKESKYSVFCIVFYLSHAVSPQISTAEEAWRSPGKPSKPPPLLTPHPHPSPSPSPPFPIHDSGFKTQCCNSNNNKEDF